LSKVFFLVLKCLFYKTYCFDKQTADSACSATAFLTGVKGNYATIGVNAKVRHNDCKASLDEENRVSSILNWAQKAGKATGIVTNTRITHATPAGLKTFSEVWNA
jgi:alkaline phosphatase